MQILYINVLTIEALTINNMSKRNKNFFLSIFNKCLNLNFIITRSYKII